MPEAPLHFAGAIVGIQHQSRAPADFLAMCPVGLQRVMGAAVLPGQDIGQGFARGFAAAHETAALGGQPNGMDAQSLGCQMGGGFVQHLVKRCQHFLWIVFHPFIVQVQGCDGGFGTKDHFALGGEQDAAGGMSPLIQCQKPFIVLPGNG